MLRVKKLMFLIVSELIRFFLSVNKLFYFTIKLITFC